MNEHVSWAVMGALGLLLIVVGFEGSLGRMLACILTPSAVIINTGDSF